MFRVPKSNEARDSNFYQRRYTQGHVTQCPSWAELAELLTKGFKDTPYDYSEYISVLKSAGLRAGATIFDYGCSWGYGSWQFARAGYTVYSYDVSPTRLAYAKEFLNCDVADVTRCPGVDCFFAAHVLEHLSDPKQLWLLAKRMVERCGIVVLAMPNGDRSRSQHPNYHRMWGEVHPLLLTSESLANMAASAGFTGEAHSSPYDLSQIQRRSCGEMDGDELLFIARCAPTKRQDVSPDGT
jgi:hypothetical protein